jgi:acetate kinase
MNVLVLRTSGRSLHYALLDSGGQEIELRGEGDCDDCPVEPTDRWASASVASRVRALLRAGGLPRRPDLIAVRVNFGGSELDGPVIYDDGVREILAGQVPLAPLHLPGMLVLLDAVRREWSGVPTVLVFETAFFVPLPRREHLYALDGDLTTRRKLRRYGYHGVHHQAACNYAAGRVSRDAAGPPLLISVYLGPHPEMAAVVGRRPVMVTSGATPLEGLPGHTSCGQLDPGIVLTLAESKRWGPEQIDQVLTQQSGLLGLVGHRITLGELFRDTSAETELARAVMRHRLLLAAGSGMAAMGGLDAIVFSGPFADLGEQLGAELAARLTFPASARIGPPPVFCFNEPLDRLVADQALRALDRQRAQ